MPKYGMFTRIVPATGRKMQIRLPICSGQTAKGNPCTAQALPEKVDGKFYCSWHHPDKSKRAISRFSPLHPKNGGKKPITVELEDKPKRKVGRPRKFVVAQPSPGDGFAASLNGVVEEMVRKALVKLLVPTL